MNSENLEFMIRTAWRMGRVMDKSDDEVGEMVSELVITALMSKLPTFVSPHFYTIGMIGMNPSNGRLDHLIITTKGQMEKLGEDYWETEISGYYYDFATDSVTWVDADEE